MFRQIALTLLFSSLLLGCAVQSEDSYVSSPKSELSRRFVDTVILGSEYGQSGAVSRFAKSPRLSIFGADSARRSMVTSATAQINRAIFNSRIQINVGAESDRSADILLYYAPMSQFASIARENGFEYSSGNSGFFWIFWNGNHEITKAVVMIASDVHTENQLRSVTLEELTQAMGAVNDQAFLNGSIFYETASDAGFAQELSVMDQKLMAFLYGRLNPGYDKRAVDYVFNRYWVD